jgi:hypothetical protein
MEEAYELANLKTTTMPMPLPKRPRSIAHPFESGATEVSPHTITYMKLALFLIDMYLRLAEQAGKADLLVELLYLRFVQLLRRMAKCMFSSSKLYTVFNYSYNIFPFGRGGGRFIAARPHRRQALPVHGAGLR